MVDAIVTPSPEVGSGSSMRSGERTLWLTAAQAPASTALTRGLLRVAPPGERATAARTPGLGRRECQRLPASCQPLLRPNRATRAADRRASECDARAVRPG